MNIDISSYFSHTCNIKLNIKEGYHIYFILSYEIQENVKGNSI